MLSIASSFLLRRPALSAAVAFAAVLLSSPASSFAAAIEGTSVVIPNSIVIDPAIGGSIGSYTYDAANDAYYIVLFGGQAGLRKIWRESPEDPWQSAQYVSATTTTPSDQLRFIRSSNVAGGIVDSSDAGSSTMSGILLNPTALTIKVAAPANYNESLGYGPVDAQGNISISYAPGQLAFITDHGTEVKHGSTAHFDWTKKVYRWDLREVGSYTNQQVDYNTGTSGDLSNPNPENVFGDYNQADWNDVFTVGLTEQALRQAYLDYRTTHPTAPALPATSNDNFGRQFAWATNGQSLYTVDSGTVAGGIYKVSATQGTARLIYSEPETNGANLSSEPAVLPTSRRNLGSGFGAGDQILFDGSKAGGNEGGISYVVDTGTAVSGVNVLVSAQQFRNFAELTGTATSSVASIAADSAGNIYFYEATTHELHKYDTLGRLSTVLNKAQLYEVNQTENGSRNDSGGMLRLQVREDATGTYVTYRGNNRYIGAVKIDQTGDFNHDGAITQSDRSFFITQYNKTFHGNAPLAVGTNGATTSDYVNYINADVNGSSQPVAGSINGALAAASVTYKDLLVLNQFVPHATGDLNWDGTALGAADWSIFDSHYKVAPSAFNFTSYSWFDGDVTFDGLVDEKDYLRLALPGDLNFDGFVGIDDLTILQSHWGQTVLARDASVGDISDDGFVGIDDLSVLQSHWGQHIVPPAAEGLLGSGAAAPEPSTFAMLGIAALVMGVARRFRRTRSLPSEALGRS